eukprot:CAMPEP_0184854816 /NCGR_PEP_ID=MMETSP0580-20130426/205_1 /TAXON_ID=1118495 /ORGANISM="Dactyliosolen fragilissimus" /LENGTH=463 /DNA_ID=CAMNT_0027349155 /DNA_START=169 /DNA_END=1557 /DNA_ORIENTATION=-
MCAERSKSVINSSIAFMLSNIHGNDPNGQSLSMVRTFMTSSSPFEIDNENHVEDGNEIISINTDDISGTPSYESDSNPSKLTSIRFEQLDASMQPQLLSDFLMEIGACSVSVTDHDRDTDMEEPIFLEPHVSLDSTSMQNTDHQSLDETYAAVIWDQAVGTNVWKRCDVTAHFPSTVDIAFVAESVQDAFDLPSLPLYQLDDVPDRDWVIHVQSSWKPIVVSGYVLRFPWHTDEDVQEATVVAAATSKNDETKEYDASKPLLELRLEGGIAFGTGEHPTTQLCLGWIRNTLTNNREMQKKNNKSDYPIIKKFLDYGAGSGVLGMAACTLSKHITATGIEIDADAVRIADHNAKMNQVQMKSYLPEIMGNDNESDSVVMRALAQQKEGDVQILPHDLDGPIYDACAANILAGPLILLAEKISFMIRPGGYLGLSGILSYQANDVVDAYSKYFDDVIVEKEISGW